MFGIEFIDNFLSGTGLQIAIRCILIIVIGFPLVTLLAHSLSRSLKNKLSAQGAMVLRKFVAYLGYILLIFTVLGQMHFDMKAFLGAAGVAGIAIGFAAQTSLSNIISGLFLIIERPFKVDDLIEIDGTIGSVESIDLLSMTIRTFENRSVRLPNETIVKSKVTNITKHPIRRIDIEIGVSYSEDIEHVNRVLHEAALSVTTVLRNPEPQVFFVAFGNSSQNFKVGCWCLKEDFITVRNQVPVAIRKLFERDGIEIPFPHITLATGKAGAPLFDQVESSTNN